MYAMKMKLTRYAAVCAVSGCAVAAVLTACGGGATGASVATADTASVASTTNTTSSNTTNTSNTPTASAAVVSAANAFYATLTETQKPMVQLSYALDTARKWSNLPAAMVRRNGLNFGAMTTAQQTAAKALIATALSSAGSTLWADVRVADNQLVTVGASSSTYGDGNYYVAFLGTPSTTGSWVLQLTGHHLTYNLSYTPSYRMPTPMFLAVEPNLAFTYNGVVYDPLVQQRTALANLGAVLTNYSSAKLSGTYDDLLFGANGTGGIDGTYPKAYPTGTTGRGVAYSTMSSADQALVRSVIQSWVNTQSNATEILASYLSDAALAETYVAYATGASVATKGNYFRVDGPRVWMEWSVQGGIILRNDIHPHAVWRDKLADYGGML